MIEHLKRFALIKRVYLSNAGARDYLNLLRFARERWLFRRRVPITVMIAATYRCQCDCAHCAVSAMKKREPELSGDEIKEIISSARRLAVPKIGFTGGEPLLRADIAGLVAFARECGLSVSVDTNGVLLDAARARELKKAGISNVNVSIDRPDAETHDRLRKFPGSFEAAVSAIKNCAAQKIPCMVSAYATDAMIAGGELAGIIKLARSLGASGVRVLFPVYSGKLGARRRPLLSEKNKAAFFRDFADSSFVCSESPLFDVIKGEMVCSMKLKLSVYVTAYGEVKYCYAAPGSLGSVREKPLAEILESSGYLGAAHPAADCPSCG